MHPKDTSPIVLQIGDACLKNASPILLKTRLFSPRLLLRYIGDAGCPLELANNGIGKPMFEVLIRKKLGIDVKANSPGVACRRTCRGASSP